MTVRFTRARLTNFADPQYRAYVQRMTMSRDNQRATRPPRQRDLFGGEAEAVLRAWLTAQGLGLSERRILEYEERRDRSSIRKYRELDALVEAPRALHVFEIKASRAANALRRALGQLAEVRGALSLIAPQVTTTILLVDTGIPTAADVLELMRAPDAPHTPPPTLADVLEAQPKLVLVNHLTEITPGDERVSVIRFSLEQIVALAGDQPLHLDWEADDDDTPPPPKPPAIHTIGDDTPDDDDNPFAAAMRRALKE
jgi:hypothetical protein